MKNKSADKQTKGSNNAASSRLLVHPLGRATSEDVGCARIQSSHWWISASDGCCATSATASAGPESSSTVTLLTSPSPPSSSSATDDASQRSNSDASSGSCCHVHTADTAKLHGTSAFESESTANSDSNGIAIAAADRQSNSITAHSSEFK